MFPSNLPSFLPARNCQGSIERRLLPIAAVGCQSDVLLRNLGVTYATPYPARQEAFNASKSCEPPIDSKITVTLAKANYSPLSLLLVTFSVKDGNNCDGTPGALLLFVQDEITAMHLRQLQFADYSSAPISATRQVDA